MALDRNALKARLLAVFREESRERLDLLRDMLARWESAGAQADAIEALFREVHSLKGGSRAVGLADIERLCHAWESLLAPARQDPGWLTRERIGLSREAHRAVEAAIFGEAPDPAALIRITGSLQAATGGQPSAAPGAAADQRPAAAESPAGASAHEARPALTTTRVDTGRLDAMQTASENLSQILRGAHNHVACLRSMAIEGERQSGRHASAERLAVRLREALPELPLRLRDAVRELLAYVDWSRGQHEHLVRELAQARKAGVRLARDLDHSVDTLCGSLASLLLRPGESLFEGMAAMLQDLARETGKSVAFEVDAAGLQVDKRIVDELRPVVMHLLRNAVAHGVEPPELRLAAGKAPSGSISVRFHQEAADRFRIVIADDGAGIDTEALRAAALAQGLIDEARAASLDESGALGLVFLSGLSTARMITEVSGRGVGMAVVREIVERLGGRIDLKSVRGAGTSVTLGMPLSLSSFRAVVVRCAGWLYALPALSVERSLRLPATAVQAVENRPTLAWNGAVLALWSLGELLGQAGAHLDQEGLNSFIIVAVSGERHALLVDEIVNDQELTIKPLGPQLRRVRAVLGAGVLGDGTVVPILHPGDLARMAGEQSGAALIAPVEAGGTRRQRLLVVDDSFTSRGLLKSILEAAGYAVAVANDGADAWQTLKQAGPFDLLVSDVEMPRMDGFALTARVRADRALGELPVVLVTALQTPEDRARGLEAGANAYLVKSGFEQDSLLDAIRRLI